MLERFRKNPDRPERDSKFDAEFADLLKNAGVEITALAPPIKKLKQGEKIDRSTGLPNLDQSQQQQVSSSLSRAFEGVHEHVIEDEKQGTLGFKEVIGRIGRRQGALQELTNPDNPNVRTYFLEVETRPDHLIAYIYYPKAGELNVTSYPTYQTYQHNFGDGFQNNLHLPKPREIRAFLDALSRFEPVYASSPHNRIPTEAVGL